MDLKAIKSIGETADTCSNSPESALVLIRELCKALIVQTGGQTSEIPYTKKQNVKSQQAKYLRYEGYSIRQIMRILGYRSTNSVQQLLNRRESSQ